ncbi:MAG: methenyltetrahydromethanopterin cyclohydrolase [Burkholderiales bacterium]
MSAPSVNALTAPLVSALIDEADSLRIAVSRLPNGCAIVDAGIAVPGGIEAGRRIAEICMGGLGKVSLSSANGEWLINVSSSNPVLSCLGSQYAGWSLNHGEGKQAFRALGSGPGRAAAVKEELYKELGYRDQADCATLVLEVDTPPPQEIVDKVVRDCGVSPDRLTFILTPTKSLAGVVQIVARVLEVALHKVHALHFPLEKIVDGIASAPLPPPAPDFLNAMGRTNDAIIFGGQVHLFVEGSDNDAKDLAQKLPASASKDYGRPFAKTFKDVQYDFYKIDPMLFAPAQAAVTALASGNTFQSGQRDNDLLKKSFGLTQ